MRRIFSLVVLMLLFTLVPAHNRHYHGLLIGWPRMNPQAKVV
jgi:hypothetical protein